MRVAIIIPTLNEEATIGRLIDSLAGDPYPTKEIIVVDGGSTDNTIDVAERSGAIALKERGRHKCPANARNQGAKDSNADLICFLDGDVDHVSERFITNAIRHFEDPRVIGVRTERDYFTDTLVSRGLTSVRSSILTKFFYRRLTQVSAFSTFIRKSVFEEIGGYPLLGVGEDTVLGQKQGEYLKNNPNKRIGYEPDSVAFERRASSFGEWFKQCAWYGRTLVPYLREAKYDTKTKLFQLFPVAYLVSIVSIPFVIVSPLFLILAFPYIIKLFLILYESMKNRDKYRLLTPLLDFVDGVGYTIGLLQYLLGKKYLSRG